MPNIKLRAPEPFDTDLIFLWENDTSQWTTSLTPVHVSRHRIANYIENFDGDLASWQQLRLMISLSQPGNDNITIGTVDLFDIDMRHRRAFIGIYIDTPHRRKGYGTQALQALAHYAAEYLDLHQLAAITATDNTAAIATLRAAGYTTSGHLRSWLRRANTYTDVLIMQQITLP